MLVRHRGHSMIVHAPAKLNLFLEILGKRDDGFHEIETLIVGIDLCDTLIFQNFESSDIRLQIFDAAPRNDAATLIAGIPTDASNLIVQAAELLRSHAGIDRGVSIRLYKRIPAESGLGGGSSDAAATLVALNHLWQLKLSSEELQSLTAQLGSDIPSFLTDAPLSVCRGRGERIEALNIPHGLHFVIARPSSGLSTAEVYRNCSPAEHPKPLGRLIDCLRQGRLAEAGQCMHNALQKPAAELNPDIERLHRLFATQPVYGHMMSGSGTAYFGICAHRRQAQSVASRLRAARIGRVFAASCRT